MHEPQGTQPSAARKGGIALGAPGRYRKAAPSTNVQDTEASKTAMGTSTLMASCLGSREASLQQSLHLQVCRGVQATLAWLVKTAENKLILAANKMPSQENQQRGCTPFPSLSDITLNICAHDAATDSNLTWKLGPPLL